uniref:Steroid dehydrogenase n=1 Tax=Anopheles christyi TaxID=43041 RepID=A0A182K3H2_9DIPT
MFCSLLACLGFYVGAIWLYENLRTPVLLMLQSIKQLVFRQKLSQRYGKWAVITGASDGIGKGYAHYLARKGMAIVLVARNEAKLAKVADEIKSMHGVETKILVADFSKGATIYPQLEKALVPLDVGILVNNVGVSHDTPMYVDEVPQKILWDLINVNVAAATLLCNILTPSMKERQRGLIINVSSIASVGPSPCLATYAASKAYMTSFSVALRDELRQFGVEVQTVRPSFVHTNMTDFLVSGKDKWANKMLVRVDNFMAYAGCTIGKVDMTCGHWSHGLQTAGIYLVPERLRVYIFGLINKKLREDFHVKKKNKILIPQHSPGTQVSVCSPMWLVCAILGLIGAYCSVCWLYENLRTPVALVLHGLVRIILPQQSLSEKYGEWAVITGASDGIGKGYAEYLARKRMNIVLIARNESKLNRVADEILRKYSVRTKVVVADFSDGEAVYDHLARELLALDVGILVNNVGLSYERGMCMDELPKKLVWDLLTVNVASVTMLCHMLIPAMKKRRRGLLINISSLSAAAPAPYLTVYSAAKVYVRNFSMALREELRPHQVEVQTVLPGFVRTNMTAFVATEHEGKPVSKQLVHVDDYVRYAGFTIGKTDRTCGYWSHGLQYAGLKLVPECVRVFVLKTIYNHLRVIGVYATFCWLYENLRTPLLLLLRAIKQLFLDGQQSLQEKYGPWAVITGGSDGIGKGYAHYLASQGMKVLLIARNEAKLKRVAEEIATKYHGAEIKICVADFSKGEQIYERLVQELSSLDIGILVNNVGVINEKPIEVDRMEKRLLWDLININVGAATQLCNIAIPSMKKRHRGLIINISSLSSLAPTPYLAIYAATKAYMKSFSLALREEIVPYGIECQTVAPGYVHTSMTEYLNPTEGQNSSFSKRLVQVNDMIRYAGYCIGKVDQTTGHWSHGIQTAILNMLPASLKLRVFTRLYTQLLHEYSDPDKKYA